MRIVFSRKGFDSAAGGCPSPIIDGRPISLPIPARRMPSATKYVDLLDPLPALVVDLTKNRISANSLCHLDPDITAEALGRVARPAGWRGALGQAGTAQSHLQRMGVGHNDLFLFWGLFRAASHLNGQWRFHGPRIHGLFGWLQVDEVIELGVNGKAVLDSHPWLSNHPHARSGWTARNAIYIASDRLTVEGVEREIKGYGVFDSLIQLTSPDSSTPSRWRVDDWLDPTRGGVGLTYNPVKRWNLDGTIQTAARGQEFVADIGSRSDALRWIRNAFERGVRK